MNGVLFLQIIFILFIAGIIVYFLRLYHAFMLEKRIAPFATSSIKENDSSLYEAVSSIFWKLVKKLSRLLKHSQIFRQYGGRYQKYILYEQREVKEGIDYVSIKFLCAFVVVLLILVRLSFKMIVLPFELLLLLFVISFFLPDIFLFFLFSKKKKRIEDDLLKAIIIMNNAFRSGKNIMQATSMVNQELEGPIQDEFRKISMDITYGLSLDVVFHRFYERVKVEDAKYIATSLTLLNKTGGDIVKVFSMIEKSIFDRKNLKNELTSLTASSRFVFKLLAVLPFFFVFLIFCLNPSYFAPFFTTALGWFFLGVILFLYILYLFLIRKVLEVEL